MSNAHYSDDAMAKLRAAVDVVAREIAQAPPAPALHAAWTQLVELLALGTAPETRECPRCRGVGMRAASRCGHCWLALAPLPLLSNGAPQRVDA